MARMSFRCADPRNVLVPFSPEPARCPSGKHKADAGLLKELGLDEDGPREALREEAQQEFTRVTGGADMTEELFIVLTAQLFAFDRLSARACFHACDSDQSARLDLSEYLLFKEAFIYENSDFSGHQAIMALRLRAVFHKYVVTRPAQRHFHDTCLTRSEAQMWVRDLCAGETHVKQVADRLLPALAYKASADRMSTMRSSGSDASAKMRGPREVMRKRTSTASDQDGGAAGRVFSYSDEEISMDDFVRALMEGNFAETLKKHDISINDLVATIRSPTASPGQPVHAFSRTVLDGRAENATLQWSAASKQSWAAMFAEGNDSRQRGMHSAFVPGEAVNEEMQLDPAVRAVGGWRGPLAPSRDTKEYSLARTVLEVAQRLARDEVRKEDCLDRDWMTEGQALGELLGTREETEQAERLRFLAVSARKQLEAEPALVRVAVPAKVFGDIHGQFRDLLMLFHQFGFPSHLGGDIQTVTYVFNGDFVDRGQHQLEVLCVLFALKVMYPQHVFLIRGNHEFRDMSEMPHGTPFKFHVRSRLPAQWFSVYDAVHQTFDWLPFAALVGGKVLVLHGGLGDGSWGLRDLEAVVRPLKETTHSFLLDVVWSDPSDSDDVMWKGVHENPDRGDDKVHLFGPDVTEEFCHRENIHMVVRSHQYVPLGYKVMHAGHLVTVFSARNYVGEDDNDGALLLFAPDRNGHLRVHPKTLLAMPVPLVDDDDLAALGADESLAAELMACFKGVVDGVRRRCCSVRFDCGECLHFLQTGQRKKPPKRGPGRQVS